MIFKEHIFPFQKIIPSENDNPASASYIPRVPPMVTDPAFSNLNQPSSDVVPDIIDSNPQDGENDSVSIEVAGYGEILFLKILVMKLMICSFL